MKNFNLKPSQTFAIIYSRDVNCVGEECQFESLLSQRSETLTSLHKQALELQHGFLLAAVTLMPSEPGWCKVDHVFYGHA